MSSNASSAAAAASSAAGSKRPRAVETLDDDDGDVAASAAGAAGAAVEVTARPRKQSNNTSARGGGSSDVFAPAPDVERVLKRVRDLVQATLAKEGAAAARPKTLAELGIEGMREVTEKAPDDIMACISETILHAVSTIMRDEGFAFDVPARTATNQVYVPELDRIVLKDKTSSRAFTSVSSVRKTTIMLRVMQLLYDVLSKGIHVTKRDLFYTDVKLFAEQSESDVVLDDVAAMLGCTRTSLHVVASDKGA